MEDDETQLDMLPDIMAPRILITKINDLYVESYIRKLEAIVNSFGSEQPILVEISSPGGSIEAGFRLFHAFESVDNPIVTYCSNSACSMGAFLFICLAKRENRYCAPDACIMIHEGAFGAYGSVSEVKTSVTESLIVCDTMLDHLGKALGLNGKEQMEQLIRANTKSRDWFIRGEDLIKFGVIEQFQLIKIVPSITYSIQGCGVSKDSRLGIDKLVKVEPTDTVKELLGLNAPVERKKRTYRRRRKVKEVEAAPAPAKRGRRKKSVKEILENQSLE